VSSGAPDWQNDIATGQIIASQITWPYRLKEKIDLVSSGKEYQYLVFFEK
jgi:hypothetical protein